MAPSRQQQGGEGEPEKVCRRVRRTRPVLLCDGDDQRHRDGDRHGDGDVDRARRDAAQTLSCDGDAHNCTVRPDGRRVIGLGRNSSVLPLTYACLPDVRRLAQAKCAVQADVRHPDPPDHQATSNLGEGGRMTLATMMAAETSWPDAALGIR